MTTHPKPIAKIETEDSSAQRLAVLIDADNAQAAIIEGLLSEIASLGEATVKRIYGDFTSPTSSQWKKVLNKFAIKPVQQFAYTSGKNATDSTLIIDAMDLLYTRRFQGFCLVSSDSDFTGLAVRIREEGLVVFGFGEEKTPEAFRNACNKFILTEVLRGGENEVMSNITPNAVKTLPNQLFQQALEQAGDENGWTRLDDFGNQLNKLRADFDPRHFGYKKLSDLVRAQTELFTLQEPGIANSDTKVLYIRSKKSAG